MSVQLLRSPPQSSSHAVTAIPQELLDSVIDHLKDDKASLRACSLSQRAWLNRSWKHLHYHVSIDMLRRVRDPSRYSYGHSPEYVDSLELLHLGHSVAAPSAVPLATRLSHVRNLTISFGAWDKLDAAQKREFLALYPNVEMLKIKGVSYTNCNDFLDFLSAFPHLSHLTLMFVYFSASSDAPCHEPTPNFDPNLPLRSLRVLDCSNEVVDALAVVLSQTQKQMSNEFSMSLEWAISRAASYAINNTTQHVFSRVGRFPTKLSLDFKAVPVSGKDHHPLQRIPLKS